jgi:RNase P subunit RPR2
MTNKIEIPANIIFISEKCKKCGKGYYEKKTSKTYLTYPIQADFKCNECGNIKRFFEPDFPGYHFTH